MGRKTIAFLLIMVFIGCSAGATSLQGTFRGEEEYPNYLLTRGEEFWEELRSIFRVRPASPINITFYDGRLDYLNNKPHPSAPESIDALLLFNRIHFILEKRRPYTNEMVLFHELVHIFQREFYNLNPHNVWFSDIQSEYLVGLHFFGPEYHDYLRQNLDFDPETIRSRLERDMDWRYNRSLGLVVMDYLLDRYNLRPDLMHQLVIALQSDNLLHRHQEVISSALDYAQNREEKYSFLSRTGIPSLPPTPGFIPTPVTFTRLKNHFVFHSFFLEGTYHSLGIWDPEQKKFAPYIVSESYLDWPAAGEENRIFYVRRRDDLYEIVLGDSQEPEKEVLYFSEQYLSNLCFESQTGTLFFAEDRGPFRHIFSLDREGNINPVATGPYQNWSPFPADKNGLYFLSNRNNEGKIPGGDLFLFQEENTTTLTRGLRLLEILDREGNKLLLQFVHPETGALALGVFSTATGNWEQKITSLPSTPYFPHFSGGEIFFWQAPFNQSVK